MAQKQRPDRARDKAFVVRLRPSGLVLGSLALLVAGALLAYALLAMRQATVRASARAANHPGSEITGDVAPESIPPWGELHVSEIELERPEEYAAAELGARHAPAWTFDELSLDQVRDLLRDCGLNADQIARALAAERVSANATSVVIQPEAELVFSLSPQTRAALYARLARWPANHYMRYPFCLPASAARHFADPALDRRMAAQAERLLYPRGNSLCFSDFEVLMLALGTDQERLQWVKALSRQRALLVRVRIRPSTDIEKLLGYWGRGIQAREARPFFEAVSRLDDGGTVSLLYLLPEFARDRLYRFPMPPGPNDPSLDCHWSTMNFFREHPDNRFADLGYTADYLKKHFDQVPKASHYGDVVLFLDKDGNPVHSGVYLAEDILFTKNGNSYAQPWMLMRIKDILALYSWDPQSMVAVFREKKS